MSDQIDPHKIATIEALEALYGPANPRSLTKETTYLTDAYRIWIERAPFFAIASIGAGGLDCSPRGDTLGEVFEVLDEKTLAFPDRRGNNRMDTLRNIVADPRIAMLFLVPGIDETLRINGRAEVTVDPALIERFDVKGKKPATVVRVSIDAVYFQCARALLRSDIWNPESFATRSDVPTAGAMIKSALPGEETDSYDGELRERQLATLY